MIWLLGGSTEDAWLDGDLAFLIGALVILLLCLGIGFLSMLFSRAKIRRKREIMYTRCDLHTHSTFSDGTATPEALVAEAERLGLRAIALTDHNTVDGLPSFLAAAEGKRVRAVAGIEISTDYGDTELHVVGLFLKEEQYDAIKALLDELRKNKERSNLALIERLNAAGYDLDYDELKASSPSGNINRAHVATILTQRGYTESVKEAFDTLLAKDGGFYEQPKRLPTLDVISFLNAIGVVSVLAHPLLSMDKDALCALLPEARAHGLDAIETHYSTYDEETTALATEIAREYGLLESGGSDYHAARKPDISLGVGRGTLTVPYSFLEALEKRNAEKAV